MNQLFFTITLLSALTLTVLSQESVQHVLNLNSANFDSSLQEHDQIMVKFYAPWCGHCQTLAPEYEEAASSLQSEQIVLAEIDCTESQDICAQHQVQGYPTLKLFQKGVPTDYEHERSSEAIVAWLKSVTGPAAVLVQSAEDLEGVVENAANFDKVILGLFNDIYSQEAEAFSAAADSLRDSFQFAMSSKPELFASSVQLPESIELPSIVIVSAFKFVQSIQEEQESPENVYYQETDFSAESIRAFINLEAFPLIAPISGTNFQAYLGRQLPFLWAFVSPESISGQDNILAELESAAGSFKGQLSFVYIDGEHYAEYMQSLGISTDLPKVIVETYDDGSRFVMEKVFSKDSVSEFAQSVLEGTAPVYIKSAPVPESNEGPVKILVGSTFDELVLQNNQSVFFVDFYAPWCPHCQELEPLLEELAHIFDDQPNIVIAKMDVTENDAPVEVENLPTIMMFAPGFEDPLVYEGDRSLKSLAEFIMYQTPDHLLNHHDAPEGEDLESETVESDSTKDEL